MKPILLKSNKIEIPFQDSEGKKVLTLWFDKGDKPMAKINEQFKKMEYNYKDLKDEDVTIEDAKKVLAEATDALFGSGSFDKIYELNPSLYVVMEYIYQISIGIKEELESETLNDVQNKYLK